ncbi:hypothetical protein Dda_3771 [Drechslerella dactyloides]|uniref:Transcriptional coactivator p15 (PC4) C-terminal domain-containing protein n=1 Tax=Drechslerella dactyloides TaxID=74499 RepID=A0AAD6J2W2_DREDA|nr:hypothetical protein Dda_3771 [Drechslerella dactyloides]
MPPKRQFTGKFTKKPFKRSYNNNDDVDASSHKRFKPSAASSSSTATAKSPDGAKHTDEEGNSYWELGGKLRRVTVSEFKGNVLVSVREYYEKDGKCLPGKKGISMSLDQFNQLIKVLPSIEQAIGQKSQASVVRPNYTTAAKHDPPKAADPESEAEGEDNEDQEQKDEEDSDAEDAPPSKKPSSSHKSKSKDAKTVKSKKRQEETSDEEEEDEEEDEEDEAEESEED